MCDGSGTNPFFILHSMARRAPCLSYCSFGHPDISLLQDEQLVSERPSTYRCSSACMISKLLKQILATAKQNLYIIKQCFSLHASVCLSVSAFVCSIFIGVKNAEGSIFYKRGFYHIVACCVMTCGNSETM